MAIRFRPDEQPSNNNSNNNRGGGNGSGGKMLMAALFFVFRYPKIGIPLLIVGGIVYFFMGGFGGGSSANDQNNMYGMGGRIDQEKYDKTLVYPALSTSSNKYGLAKAASLRANAPRRLNQGSQGSCVGWASAYAARTILESVATGAPPNSIAYSPSFLYNQIGLQNCQGAYTGEALQHMTQKGLVAFSKFAYNENDCSRKPDNQLLREAMEHRIRGYNRLTRSGKNYDVDLEAVKQNIAQGAPVIIAMKVPYSFQDMMGKKVWQPSRSDARGIDNLGGHAMCLIGYDDDKQLFEIMNSWGEDWGDQGFVFVPYDAFKTFCREAYGVFPHGKAKTASTTEFAIQCGLYNLKNKSAIPVRRVRDNLFETTQKIAKGTGFKIEITNALECYAYVFSKETEADGGAAIVVFPPNRQYSTFLGIVGTRLFPDGGELYPDDKGDKDYMAIVYSKKELNPEQLRQQIDNANTGNYHDDVMKAVGSNAFTNINYKDNQGYIAFNQTTRNDDDIAVVVIAVDK